jgi:hypothetical protein
MKLRVIDFMYDYSFEIEGVVYKGKVAIWSWRCINV